MNTRRDVLKGAAALLAAPAMHGRAQGTWPAGPITLVVQGAPGGASDQSARTLSVKLADQLRVPVIIANEPAASGMVAVRRVARAKADGYTLLMIGTKSAIAAGIGKTDSFDLPRDFALVALVSATDLAVVVAQGSPLASTTALVDVIRKKPGKVTLGVGDVPGGIQHLGAALFKTAIKGDLVIVPYGSAGKLAAAVRSGEVDAGFELLPGVMGLLRAGEMRAIALAGYQRHPELPNVPTLTEAGIAKCDVVTRSFIAAPARTPAAVVQVLNTEINRILSQPEMLAGARQRGTGTFDKVTPAGAHEQFVVEIGRWREAVRLTGVSVE